MSSYAYGDENENTQEYLERCHTQETMLNVSACFTALWSIALLVWVGILINHCRIYRCGQTCRDKCQPLQWLLIIVPFFHCGDAICQLYQYTHCKCMHCVFENYSALFAWYGSKYTFHLGRFSALLLCIFLISTGTGTVRPGMLWRNAASLVIIFGGLVTSLALGLPLSVAMNGVNVAAAFVFQCLFYVMLVVVVIMEATGNSRVLKAQLVMIRDQGINPSTCPAFSKFKMFTRLRRWVFGYFVFHTFLIISQQVPMALWQHIILIVIWELAQLFITATFGYLFRSVDTNFLDREEHLPNEEVRRLVTAEEVALGWDDLQQVAEDNVSGATGGTGDATNDARRLQIWQQGTRVPAPPAVPQMISIFSAVTPRRTGRTEPIASNVPVATATLVTRTQTNSPTGSPTVATAIGSTVEMTPVVPRPASEHASEASPGRISV